MVASVWVQKSLTGPAGWSCGHAPVLAVTAVLILGIELLAPQILSVFHPDQGTMEIAVRNLRIEILGQIFYASFMVYNALPMGAGHTMFALGSSLLNCIVVRVILP